jgi:hypothetical protein
LLAADFTETNTLTGTRMYVLAVIEHATRRIRILGATGRALKSMIQDLVHPSKTPRFDDRATGTSSRSPASRDSGCRLAVRVPGGRVARVTAEAEPSFVPGLLLGLGGGDARDG